MDVPTITMPAADARAKVESYRALDPHRRTPEDEAALAGYRAIAAGKPVIDLALAMKAAGLNDQGLPRLAIARADERAIRWWAAGDSAPNAEGKWVWRSNGGGRFEPGQMVRGSVQRRTRITPLPADTFDRGRVRRVYNVEAIAPTIPPEHRPEGRLDRFHVLWEAVWQPAPPVDPLLLRHLGGFLYVVLAEWDLTELEQAVLRGRILMTGR
jgi:hypothetical protein